jgi:hypothetical protein
MIFIPCITLASPADAERFAHIAGINLADYPNIETLASFFGHTTVVRTGDAATAEARACYLTSDGEATLEFIAGELDRGFEIRRPTTEDRQCGIAKTLKVSMLEVAGVKLGMSRADFDSLFDKPPQGLQHLSSHYSFVREDKGEKWYIDINIGATFSNSQLQSFSVSRSSSD